MASKFKLIFADFLRSLHQLWLEVSGALFIAFGAAFGFHAVQEFRKHTAADESLGWQAVSAAVLALLTVAFGLHSFWKSRNLR
jgi:uncharacterized membrane protein